MFTALPAITVSTIFLAWRASRRDRERRDRLLRERIAYMLWVAANDGDTEDEDDDEDGPPNDDLERRLRTYTFHHRH